MIITETDLKEQIEEAVKEAIEEEREACAKIAEEIARVKEPGWAMAAMITEAIRARSNTE